MNGSVHYGAAETAGRVWPISLDASSSRRREPRPRPASPAVRTTEAATVAATRTVPMTAVAMGSPTPARGGAVTIGQDADVGGDVTGQTVEVDENADGSGEIEEIG